MKKTYSLKTAITALLLTAFCINANAQAGKKSLDSVQTKPTQAVFFELFGPGLVYSANYDTRFNKRNDGLGMRIGVSYLSQDGDKLFTIPLVFNYLLGKQGKYFEVGAGITYYNVNTNFAFFNEDHNTQDTGVYGTLNFGYRLQPINGGFNFRAGVSPVISSSGFAPYWPYVGFGYSF